MGGLRSGIAVPTSADGASLKGVRGHAPPVKKFKKCASSSGLRLVSFYK